MTNGWTGWSSMISCRSFRSHPGDGSGGAGGPGASQIRRRRRAGEEPDQRVGEIVAPLIAGRRFLFQTAHHYRGQRRGNSRVDLVGRDRRLGDMLVADRIDVGAVEWRK